MNNVKTLNDSMSECLSSSILSSSEEMRRTKAIDERIQTDNRIRGASISSPSTPRDTPVPIRRIAAKRRNSFRFDKNHRENRANAMLVKYTKNEKQENDNDRKMSSSSASGTEDVSNETKSVNGTKTKKKRNSLAHVRKASPECEKDTDSSITSSSNRRSFAAHRLAALRQLSVSHTTFTDVSNRNEMGKM